MFSLPEQIIPGQTKQLRIKQVFKTLRHNETVGIYVKASAYQHQIIREGQIPDEYNEVPHVIRYMNYRQNRSSSTLHKPRAQVLINTYPSQS